jgi:hypothetical protein
MGGLDVVVTLVVVVPGPVVEVFGLVVRVVVGGFAVMVVDGCDVVLAPNAPPTPTAPTSGLDVDARNATVTTRLRALQATCRRRRSQPVVIRPGPRPSSR